jgi:hypothetical protein
LEDFTDSARNQDNPANVFLYRTSVSPAETIYFGGLTTFDKITLQIDTAGSLSGSTVTWQYWNGTIWDSLSGVSANAAGGFDGDIGSTVATFTKPGDWDTTTLFSALGDLGPYYYVRMTVSGGTTSAAEATGISVNVTSYLPFNVSGDITINGLTVTAIWIVDVIA